MPCLALGSGVLRLGFGCERVFGSAINQEIEVFSVSSTNSTPAVSVLSKPLFVTYPNRSVRTFQSAQVLVLTALLDSRVAQCSKSRLVTVSVKSSTELMVDTNTKISGKRVIQLDVENEGWTIRDLLFPAGLYMSNGNVMKQKIVNIDEGYLHFTLSSWSNNTELNKALIVGSYMATTNALAFTLRFSPDRQQKLKGNSGRSFRVLRNHLAEVKRLGPTMMTLELDKQGRPHIHGIVATDASVKTVRAALWPAGGTSGNPGFNPHKLDVGPVADALGWTCYMTKDLLALPDAGATALIDMSNPARRAGEAHLLKLRELSLSKLGINPDMRGRAAFYSQSAGKKQILVSSKSVTGMTRH